MGLPPGMKQIFLCIITCLFLTVPTQAQLFNEQGLKFMRLFDWINTRYVDSINVEKFSDEVIRETLHKLDPHSVYLTKEEVAELNEPLEGNFEGIGVTFQVLNDTIYIISSIPGGPSESVGIRAGDRIIKIDGENVAGAGITAKQVTSKLKGKKGEVVKVDIKRHKENELLSFSIIRDKIPIYSIDAAYNINSSTGYIRLSRFSHSTSKELTEALSKFKKDKISNIILDVSGNGGGYFDVAIDMADELLDSGKLIVYTQGVHSSKKDYSSTSKGLFEDGKLVIIIDEGSASASEIVAGAIQDWDRGLIIGRRSFGKGLVQSQFLLPDESVVRLTIARYYTPTGRSIQKPYTNGYGEYSKELTKRFKQGELYHKDSIHFPDSLKYYTLTRKRLVYGGGGIMPDLFVPVDTSYYSEYYRKLLSKGIVNSFTLQYLDGHRNELIKEFNDFSSFKKIFRIDQALLDDLITYAEKEGIPFKQNDFELSKQALSFYLKASIARNLWNKGEYFEIINETDPSYKKAVEVMNNWNYYWNAK
jgi:carboxyl-terminal processing protease